MKSIKTSNNQNYLKYIVAFCLVPQPWDTAATVIFLLLQVLPHLHLREGLALRFCIISLLAYSKTCLI